MATSSAAFLKRIGICRDDRPRHPYLAIVFLIDIQKLDIKQAHPFRSISAFDVMGITQFVRKNAWLRIAPS